MARCKIHSLVLCTLALFLPAAAEPLLQLKKGDNIAIVGSGLADRQQHQAWFEALIHKAYPEMNLTIRNFGFAADEFNIRPRSDGTPPLEWYLAMKKGDTKINDKLHYYAGTNFGADVILAYWGFNESFKGPQGVEEFKKNLGIYLTTQLVSNYNGEGAPRIILFSPIAHEDLRSPDFSDGAANNINLKLYTGAMAEVAKSKNVPFVDLFTPSLALYSKATAPLSINGIHLTDEGDKQLAPIQFKAVFDSDPVSTTDPAVAKIRDAVLDKNTEWHHRYRAVDQYNIYGDRGLIDYKDIKDEDNLTSNNLILGQEMAQRDVKAENRDKRVWAAAQGKEIQVNDDNLPAVSLTPANFADPVPYMDPEEATKYLKVPPYCKIELVASEKTFPDLVNPVQMAFDTKGRLWLAVWPAYPATTPTAKVFDKLLVCDLDPQTGKISKMTTFADGLNCPTGFQFYKDGVVVIQSPDLLYLRDTDGDGKEDSRVRLLHGLDAADSHHETNSICYEPGGAMYLSDGVFHRSGVETFDGPIRNVNGAIYRYEPVTGKFTRHAPYNFLNPHGRVFDYWGNDLITDATGNDNYFGPAMSGHLDTGAHPALKTFWGQPSRPCAGTAILSSRHFPDDWQGNFLNANVLGMQGVFRAELHGQGSGIAGRTLEHLVSADLEKNPYFRPAGITVAPDGSLYLMDWSQYLIGHLQHHLRDPHRDHAHGRLYRITYEGRPLLVPKKIDGQPIASLLPLLKEPEDDVRLRVKMELAKHDAKEVAAATVAWVATLDPKDSALEHHLLEALWVHQWNNVVNLELLARVLKSSEPRARAQAVRVIGYWRDRVPRALAMVKAAADDPAPRVRLEAVRVASFFREIAAADAALTVLKQPMDEYLSYTFAQTMKQLQPWWKDAIREGKELAVGNPAGINFLLDSVPSADLANLPKTATIYAAILNRPDVTKAARTAALTELSKLKQSSSPTDTLLGILKAAPITENQGTTDLCALLLMQSATSLKSARKTLLELSLTAASATVRQNACAALITADGSLEPVIEAVKWDPKALLNFVTVLPLVKDAALRSTGYTFAKNLLSTPTKETRTLKARYIRISLPRVGILSLAEVQVFSGGNNIALASKATQQSTGYGFGADRANDGDTNGNISVNSITHTAEGSDHPWWELDLGSEHPVENITIWNRTDGSFNTRLEGFELTALDATRQQVFTQSGNPFPSEAVKIHLQDQTEQQIRRAAIQALAHLGKDPVAAFDTLASLIKKNDEVATAAQSMAIIPITSWPKEQAGATAKGIFEWARTIPVASRTTAEYTATLQVAHQLVSLLPPHQVASATKAIRSLTVPIHTIKCVREQLRYDTTRFVVEAGKPYQILFENPDAMPHNLVIVMPGTLQEVAAAAQIQPPDKLDSSGRAYVLAGDSRIVEATKLVLPGKSETLNLTAPTVEGTYPYACTFPGHWSVMKGEMIITKDVEAYLAAHPEK